MEKLQAAVARARRVLACVPIEKTIWSSPAGKKRLAPRLAAMLPPHATYVEPFAGSAAVLFAKEPAAVEVLADGNLDIATAYQAIKRLTSSQLDRLEKMPWTGDKATFLRVFDTSPKDDLQKLYRFLYITHFSYGRLRGRSFSPSSQGQKANTVRRLKTFGPRLKKVRIYRGDYENVVRTFDSKTTAFFFDPPYAGYNADVGEKQFDEERFYAVLKSLKGKFLLTYGVRGKLPRLLKEGGFVLKRIRTPRIITNMRGVTGSSVLTQLVVTNYTHTNKKVDVETWNGQLAIGDHVPAVTSSIVQLSKSIALIKGVNPSDERFVLGIVLEPEVVDAQQDIYSAEEIRQAAHRFMGEFGGLGLMHQTPINDQVKIVESYITPADLSLGGIHVRKGTWLLAVRILSDALWDQVRTGELTGFSIGGSARRIPTSSPLEAA